VKDYSFDKAIESIERLHWQLEELDYDRLRERGDEKLCSNAGLLDVWCYIEILQGDLERSQSLQHREWEVLTVDWAGLWHGWPISNWFGLQSYAGEEKLLFPRNGLLNATVLCDWEFSHLLASNTYMATQANGLLNKQWTTEDVISANSRDATG
jgi:hypothetical protein